MSDLNAYLQKAGIDPAETALCFHKPVERAFAHFLPQLLVDEAALFEVYQSTYSDRAAQTIGAHRYVASFIGHPDGWAVFAGLFRVNAMSQRGVAEIADIPEVQRLYDEFGVCSEFYEGMTQSVLWFDLTREAAMAELVGRLEVAAPMGGSYVRGADQAEVSVVRVTDCPVLDLPMPDWHDLVLLAREVKVLPKAWATELAEWRGVYLLTDERDGKPYIGGSFGAADMLSTWRAHVEGTGDVPARLAPRDPMRFRFAVLERIETPMSEDEGALIVKSWIARLNTVKFGLNAA